MSPLLLRVLLSSKDMGERVRRLRERENLLLLYFGQDLQRSISVRLSTVLSTAEEVGLPVPALPVYKWRTGVDKDEQDDENKYVQTRESKEAEFRDDVSKVYISASRRADFLVSMSRSKAFLDAITSASPSCCFCSCELEMMTKRFDAVFGTDVQTRPEFAYRRTCAEWCVRAIRAWCTNGCHTPTQREVFSSTVLNSTETGDTMNSLNRVKPVIPPR